MDAKLIVVGGQATKSEVPLSKFPVLIGRNRTADLPIAHPLVSRNHCEIYTLRGVLVVRDLESANGTKINDELITEEILKPGSRLTVGPLTFVAIYKYSGEIPDLESLRASEEEHGPFFEEASVDEPISLSAEDIAEADMMDDIVGDMLEDAPKSSEKPKPGSKLGVGKSGKPSKVSDKEVTLEFNSKREDDSMMDLKLEDLLLDSVVDPGKPAGKPTAGESGPISPYANSGVQVRAEEGVIARNELTLNPSAKGGGKTPPYIEKHPEKPAAKAGAKPPVAPGKPEPKKPEPKKDTPKPKPPAQVQMASSIDGTVAELALSLEDSEDFVLQDSGVSKRAKLTDQAIDESLDQAIIDASTSSFDAVKLLTGGNRKPPDMNSRGAARDDDGKQVISFVLSGKEWENSGVHADQLRESKQPTDYLLRLQLPDAGKIRVGTPVRVAGIDVGMVTDLNWVATGGQLRAEALLNIQKRLGEVLRDDCRINVQEIQDTIVIVIESPGTTDKHLENGQVLLPAQ